MLILRNAYHYHVTLPSITINIFNTQIKSKSSINILGVIFDSKHQRTSHVCKAIQKSNRSLCAMRLIKKYFTKQELCTLLTSNFYSILYYNSEIWHIPSLNPNSKQLLMSASAKALRICVNDQSTIYSYIDMHKITNRATPSQILVYKHAILLYKLYNTINSTSDWVKLNFQQTLTSRQVNFKISQTNCYRIGLNLICNRLTVLNNKIPLKWLSLSIESFKLKCKEKFL